MTEREILLSSMKHIGSGDVVPHTLAFDCPVLQEKVNRYYGGNWQKKVRQFIHYPFYVSTTREVPVEGKSHYLRDIFGSIWRTDRLPWHLETPVLPNVKKIRKRDEKVALSLRIRKNG
jgi:hypothetical protein